MVERRRRTRATPASLRFSTRGIAAADRVQLWEEHNHRALIPLDIRTLTEAPLRAAELNVHLDNLRLARVRGSAQVVERSEAFIRDHPGDMVAFYFALRGEAFHHHRDGHELLRPGQAMVHDVDRPFMRGFARGLEELVLTVPRGLLEEVVGAAALRLPARFEFGRTRPEAHALVQLVHDAVASATAGHDTGLAEGADVERSLLDLVQIVTAGGGVGEGAGYRVAARDFVERHLGDPDLSTARVADAVGISERQLSRVYAESGQPLGEHIRTLRLDRAADALVAPQQQTVSIGTLAGRLGFRSAAYFSRAFKDRFGVTPMQVRRAARAGHLLDFPPTDDILHVTDVLRSEGKDRTPT